MVYADGVVRTKALPFCCTSTVFLFKTVPFRAVQQQQVRNFFKHYVRPQDGMLVHHGVELPASCRALTVLALHEAYTSSSSGGGGGGGGGAKSVQDSSLGDSDPGSRFAASWTIT
eukprot:SAG22_NODE_440_length_10484_cov_19.751661_6_plen_115_part_00